VGGRKEAAGGRAIGWGPADIIERLVAAEPGNHSRSSFRGSTMPLLAQRDQPAGATRSRPCDHLLTDNHEAAGPAAQAHPGGAFSRWYRSLRAGPGVVEKLDANRARRSGGGGIVGDLQLELSR